MTYQVLKPRIRHITSELSTHFFTKACLNVDRQILKQIVDVTNAFIDAVHPIPPKDLPPRIQEFLKARPFLLCLVVWVYENLDDRAFVKDVYMLFAMVHFYFQFTKFFKLCNDTRLTLAAQSIRERAHINRFSSFYDYLAHIVDTQVTHLQPNSQIVYRAFVRLSNNIRQTLRSLAATYYKTT
jgi:hypothetical protein